VTSLALSTEKRLEYVAPNLWTAEGPVVPYKLGPFIVPCPTRMTVIRNERSDLLIHSPIPLEDDITGALEHLGRVTAILVPNSFHHLSARAWSDEYRSSALYVPTRLSDEIGLDDRARLASEALAQDWPDVLRAEEVDGGSWSEIALFHVPTKTLVLTDLMQNFEVATIKDPVVRALLRIGGAASSFPTASLEMRLPVYLRGRRRSVRRSFDVIRSWRPHRILIAHGPQPVGDPAELLARGFSWA
jgi:hypothetical protein